MRDVGAARGSYPGAGSHNVSKTANNTHRRAMRTVTPVSRAGRAGAGAAMAAAMLFGGAAAATADPQADAPQADAASAQLSPAIAPVGIPAIEVATAEAEPALAPVAGTISIEVGPTEEEIAAAEAAEREAAELEAAELEAAEQEQSTAQDDSSSEGTETRGDDSASRSEERSSRESGSEQEESGPSESSSSGSSSSGSSSSESSSSQSSTQEKTEEKSAPAPSAAKGGSILATARSGIGTPYVYGGTSPSGWDCSGFVQWVYAQHGVNLPRGAGDQAAAGTVISRSEARPGDLVYKPGHIGIYAGGNQFVDAGNSRVDTSERNIYSGSWTFIRVG